MDKLGEIILHLMDNVFYIWMMLSFAELFYRKSNGSFIIGMVAGIVIFFFMPILETSPNEVESKETYDDVSPCRTMLNASIVLMLNRFFGV